MPGKENPPGEAHSMFGAENKVVAVLDSMELHWFPNLDRVAEPS